MLGLKGNQKLIRIELYNQHEARRNTQIIQHNHIHKLPTARRPGQQQAHTQMHSSHNVAFILLTVGLCTENIGDILKENASLDMALPDSPVLFPLKEFGRGRRNRVRVRLDTAAQAQSNEQAWVTEC